MSSKLLAGPIVRRATKNRVCVWLATREKADIKLEVLDADGKVLAASERDDLDISGYSLGANLHVYLLQARPEDGDYPNDCLLSYRILESSDSGLELAWDLRSLGLTYGNAEYPSFFLSSNLSRVLYGSCRKPHGADCCQPSRADALSFGDDELNTYHDDLSRRPSLMVLGGDQIYADDVAISLLAMLRQQAVALTGFQELLPSSKGDVDPAQIPLGRRKKVLREAHSGFTSGESHNHLLSFGEFAAMYVYAFGNRDEWQPVWDWEQLKSLGVDNEEKARKAWEKEQAALQRFQETLPKVRRLLANIATYMIFDDHDVTDDWNITGAWYGKVRDSGLGCRVVSNALAAYWAFQGWGNDPDNFDKDLVYSIVHQVKNHHNDGSVGERYDLFTWKHRGWGFSVPSNPPIIAVDSRTQRQPDNTYYPPRLLDRYALDWLRVEWAKLKTDMPITGEVCPILIATTPVMGFSPIETLQHAGLLLASALESWKPINILEKIAQKDGYVTGWIVTKMDAEAWGTNKEGYAAFLATLADAMGIRRCVFLSGDVHYSFTAIAWFQFADKRLDCYQLTSSALSNSPGNQGARIQKIGEKKTEPVSQRNWTIWPKQFWKSKMQLLPMEGSDLRVASDCNLGLVEFENGLPIQHTLLNGEAMPPVYQLPEQPLP
jgi:hypothetical protein